MPKILVALMLGLSALTLSAQTLIDQGSYDSRSLVDTNSTSNSASTVNTTNNSTSTSTATSTSTVNSNSTNTNTSVNTNNNIQSGTVTNNNNNVNSGTMTYNNNNVNTGDMTNRNINTTTSVNTNTNINTGTMTYNNNNVSTSTNNNINTGDMTNRNINTTTSTNTQLGDMTNRNINTTTSVNANTNTSTSTSANVNQNVQTGDMTNRNINDSSITQRIIQPPPTAVAPAMISGGNQDLCTTGSSGSVQTQVFGVSSGGTVRDLNCERLKLSKTLYDMGMKVAAVATMCQDRRVFDAMLSAGTPCPVNGKIGTEARVYWEQNPSKIPALEKATTDDTLKKVGIGAVLGALVHVLF